MLKPVYITLAVVAVLSSSFALPAHAATKAPIVYVPRRLDGIVVPKGQENNWPIAVMIDEHTAARPQSGLSKASVVYESLAEGGIPRFMAIFGNAKDLKNVGPIRSTRPYFLQYAAEYHANLVHAGGSPDALKYLKQLRLVNFEGISGPYAKYFFRAFGGGVHGLYTTGAKIASMVKVAKYTNKHFNFQAWQFVDNAPASARPKGNHGMNIDLGAGFNYRVKYVYSAKQNSYERYTGGRPQTDRMTGKPIYVRNVITINVPKEKVIDAKGRINLQIVGKGSGTLLQNGVATKITWQKKSPSARTIFTDASGQEVQLVHGNTWITIVPKGHKVQLF